MNALLSKGISTQIHYIPIPMHPYYRKLGYNMKGLSNAKKYYETAVSIPIHYKLDEKILKKIVKSIKNTLHKK